MDYIAALFGRLGRCLIALAGGAFLFAQTASAEPALWVVRDKDSTIYLFGTVHILRADTEWRTPKIEAAFANSSELLLEVEDVSSLGAQVVTGLLTARYGLSPSKPLSSRLTAEEYAALDRAARSAGFSARRLDIFRPWLAAMLIQTSPVTDDFRPEAGVEMRLQASSWTRRIPVKGLETIEQQIRIFGDLSEEQELAFLREALKGFQDGSDMLDALIAEWVKGDLVALEKLAIADMKQQSPAVYDALLTRRNASWAAKIEEMLKGSGVSFVAVGAAHLIGPDSVQAHLEAKGIMATRH